MTKTTSTSPSASNSVSGGDQTTTSDGLSWREYPSTRSPLRGIIGSLGGLVITVIVMVLIYPWLLTLYAKSLDQGITTTCILLFVLCFVLFGILLGRSIGVGRFTTGDKTASSETSTTSTTTTA